MAVISSSIRFSLLTTATIPSIACSLFCLYHFLTDRTLRRNLNNHISIILLFNCLTNEVVVIPLYLHFHLNNGSWIRSLLFCEILSFIDWANYVILGILFAWANIEKHILIFHDNWVSTSWKRLFVHYIPPIFLLSYCLIFYFIFIFFPPCTNRLVQSSAYCVSTCMQDNYLYTMWETIVNLGLPALIIIFSSISLLVRTIWQKYRIHRHVQWRQHRKMTIQVLLITLLYLVLAFPFVLIYFLFTIGIWNPTIQIYYIITNFISTFTYFLYPFVCMLSLPNLKSKLRKIFIRQRLHAAVVHPASHVTKTRV